MTDLVKQPASLNGLMSQEQVKKKFAEVLGNKAPMFMQSVISATKANAKLSECAPDSILSSAMVAATMDLPINESLGFAYMVPYRTAGRMVAQFQLG